MEREIVLEKRQVVAREDLTLAYTLSKRMETNGLVLYSLLIEENDHNEREFVFLDALTDDKDKAIELFHLFVNESVTPCTAEEILHEVFYAP